MTPNLAAEGLSTRLAIHDDRIARVLRLHVPSPHHPKRARPACKECGNPYPCLTVRILRGQDRSGQ